MSSYSDVFFISHERGYEEDIRPGDLVRTGDNAFPQFHVIAIDGDKAWLRNVQTGGDFFGEVNRCRKLAPEPARLAAE